MSGTISEEEFVRNISEIAENSENFTCAEHRWTLVKVCTLEVTFILFPQRNRCYSPAA